MRRFLSIIFSISLLFALLITSAELLLYGPYNWYEREYKKYDVEKQMIKEISMGSLLDVTDEMMDYLHGDREDLAVYAVRDGINQEFFTDREKAHMVDVRRLFIVGIAASRVCYVICLAIIIYFIADAFRTKKERTAAVNKVLENAAPSQLPKDPKPASMLLASSFCGSSATIFAAAILITFLFASDFTRYFVAFHHVFFDNDLWILYPYEDDMINMLPEGFFSDTALAIVVIYLVMVLLLITISVLVIRANRRKSI